MHRDKKNRKKKGRKRMTSNKNARKEEEPACQNLCANNGVTSVKLAGKINADRSFVGRFVREAAVRTYKRIRRPKFRPRLEERQKSERGKSKGRKTHFEPRRRRDGPPCCATTSSYRGFLGCPQAGGWHGRLEPQNEEVWRRRIGKCLYDLGWGAVQCLSMILAAKTSLRMAEDT